jgi:hypothetical protein
MAAFGVFFLNIEVWLFFQAFGVGDNSTNNSSLGCVASCSAEAATNLNIGFGGATGPGSLDISD